MIQEEIKVRVLVASDNHFLTQASEDVAIEHRVISQKVYLAKSDDVENWKEITAKEADDIQSEQEKYLEEMDRQYNQPIEEITE